MGQNSLGGQSPLDVVDLPGYTAGPGYYIGGRCPLWLTHPETSGPQTYPGLRSKTVAPLTVSASSIYSLQVEYLYMTFESIKSTNRSMSLPL